VPTYAETLTTIGSWFYDNVTGQLSVHIAHESTPESLTIQYGQGFGFSDNGVVYVDSTLYLPYIKNVPAIQKQEDIVGYSKPSFLNSSVTVANENGVLDDLKDEYLTGNTGFLSYVDDDLIVNNQVSSSQLIRLATWFIDNINWGMDEIQFSVQDNRKIEFQVPTRKFSIADYPTLNTDDAGKLVPLIYGKVRRAPATPTEPGTTGSTSATFRVAEEFTTIDQVYVKIGDTWVTRSTSSETPSIGTFRIPNARATVNDAPYECVVDLTGIAVTHASDIIKDLHNRYLSIPFNSLYYDTIAWALAETSLPTCGILVDQATDINQVINDVQNGVYPGFRYAINSDGKRTIIIDDRTKAISKFIDSVLVFNKEKLPVDEITDYLFNSVTIAYNKEYNSGKLNRVTNSSYNQSLIDNYQWHNTTEIPSLLNDDTLATAFAAAKALEYSTPQRIISPLLADSSFFTTEIYDIVAINTALDSDAETWTGISPSRPYFGVLVCQVLSVAPDYANKTTQLSLRVIADREYSGDIELLAADDDLLFGGDEVGFFEVVE
jgi:hypothetical protein